MAERIEIPVSLGLQNAQQQIEQFRQMLNKSVRVDSSAFKDIGRYLDKMASQADALKGKMGEAFKTSSGSRQFLRQYEQLISMLENAGEKFTTLGVNDIAFSAEDTQKLTDYRNQIQQLETEIKNLQKGKIGNIFEGDAIANADKVREAIDHLKLSTENLTFSKLSSSINTELAAVEGKITSTSEKLEKLNGQIEAMSDNKLTELTNSVQSAIDRAIDPKKNAFNGQNQSKYTEALTRFYNQFENYTGKTNFKTTGNVETFLTNESNSISQWAEKTKADLKKAEQVLQQLETLRTTALSKDKEYSTGDAKRAQADKLLKSLGLDIDPSKIDATNYVQYIGKIKEAITAALKEKFGVSSSQETDELRDAMQAQLKTVFDGLDFNQSIDAAKLKASLNSIFKNIGLDDSTIKGLVSGLTDKMDPASAFQSILEQIKNYKLRISKEASTTQEDLNKLNEVSTMLRQAQAAVGQGQSNADASIDEKRAKIENLINSINDLIAIYNKMNGTNLHLDLSGLEEGKSRIESFIESLNKLENKQKTLENVQSAVSRWMGFWQVLNMTKSAINDMKQHIQELDSVMTQISVVTNFSQEDLWGQISTYSEIARQYGVAIKGVYEVSQIYYQQGLQQNDVMTLTTETLKMARIAGLDYATAADYMTTAIRGFKLEMTDAAHVTDVFSALAATTASSTEEIATAISKTAASAQAVGASFEATSAMMATMIATTRESATNIGTALKSVISRYGEMTSDPSKIVDSEGEEMSLNRVDAALQTVGITIHDTAGQFRDFDDVILELMEKWDSLDSLSQRYIATLMAGNRQQSRFLALVSNVDEYKKALETAVNSEGAGELQTLKTLDSIDAKIEKMKVTIQEFYTSSGLEELYKNVLDTITNIVSAANSLPKTFGKIPVQALTVGMSIVNVIKSVITLIISEIQSGLQQIQGKAANTFEGLIISATTHGEEIGKAVKKGIEQGAEGAGSTIGLQLKGIILRNLGAIASLAGSALALKGFNDYGSSISERTDQLAGIKTFSGGILGVAGSAISGAATGAMMGSAAGPGGMAVGAVLGGVKGLISNFATLASGIDMMNVTLARSIELSKKRVESAQEEELRAKNSEKNLSQAAEKLKELEEHRYDSIESEKEYYDYMAQLADSYPEYISSINEAGNAIMLSTNLETALASAREITAQKTLAATEAELEQSKLQLEAYKNFSSNLATLGETSDIVEIGFQAAKKYGTGNQTYEKLFTAYNMANPNSKIDIGIPQTTAAEMKAKNLWTNEPQIREQILAWAREEGFTRQTNDNDKKNDFIKALDDIIAESENELSYKQLTGGLAEDAAGIRKLTSEQLSQAISRATNMAQNYIDSQTTAINNITKLYTQEQFDQKVLSSLSKETEANKTILDQYKNLLSFGLNAQFAGMNIDDIPAEQWEQAFSNLSQWIINNQDAALTLMNIDYSQYINAEEIKKAIPNYEGLNKDIRNGIEKNLNETRTTAITLYENQIKGIFGNEQIKEWLKPEHFTTRTLTAIQSDLKQYQSLLDKQQYAQAEAYLHSMEEIYGENGIGSLNGENQTKAYSIIKDLDLSDPEALRSAAETFAGMGSEFAGLSQQFTNVASRWAISAATLLEQLSSSAQATAKSIESSTSDMSKVFKYSEALEKARALMDVNEGVQFKELFTFDKDLGGYIKTAKAFSLEIAEFQKTSYDAVQQSVTDNQTILPQIDSVNNTIKDQYLTDIKNESITGDRSRYAKQQFKQRLKAISPEASDTDLDRLWTEYTAMIDAFEAQSEDEKEDWNTFTQKYLQERGSDLVKQLEEIQNMPQQMAQEALQSFDYASVVSGKGTVQSKETLKALLITAGGEHYASDINQFFDEYYTKLITGNIEEYNRYLKQFGLSNFQVSKSQANRARFESLTSLYEKIASGDVVWDALTEQEQVLLNSVDGVNLAEGASAAQVGAAADNVWSAIIKLIEAGAGTLNEVADTIAGKADKAFKDSNAGKQYNLLTSYKDGFTPQEAQELGLLNNDGTLKTEFTSYLERGSNGNWVVAAGQDAASVIEILAQLLSISIDKTTDEYKNAIKDGINQAITDANAADTGKQATSALQSLVSGKLGDRIDVSELASVAGDIYEITSEYLRDELIMSLDPEEYDAEYKKALKAAQTDITSKRNKAVQSVLSGSTFDTSTAELYLQSIGYNTDEISNLPAFMEGFGFEWDNYLQQFKASADTIWQLRARIADARAQGASNETLNALRAQVDQIDQQKQIDTSAAYSAIVSNYQSLGTDAITNFANAIGIGYESVIKAFELTRNGDGTYKLDLAKLSEILASGKDAVGKATYNAMLETVAGIQDNILSSITGAAGFVYQGTNSTADMQKFVNELNTLTGSNLGIEDAFSYDTILNTFTLNANAMKRYADAQKAELAKLGLSGEAIDEYIKDQTVTLMQQNMDIESFLNAQGVTAKSREASKLATQIVDWMRADGSKLTDEALLTMAEQWINQIEQGGTLAVEAIKAIKGENATTSELEAAFNNSQIAKFRTAMSDLEKGVGETVTGLAMNIMQVTDGFELAELDDGSAVITAVGDMVQAYANLYAAMKSNADATTGDLNSTYAKLLTAADQKNIDTLDVLENAAGMTYDAFAEILTRYDKSFEDVLSKNFVESTGFGKVRITNFEKFAAYMDFDINSPEYAEAYNAYVDSMIALKDQPKQTIQNMAEEIKSLANAKIGDNINVADLARNFNGEDSLRTLAYRYGANFKDGILSITEQTDIPGLMAAIANEAAAAGQMIPEQLAEIADAIESMLSNIVSLLGNGLSGNLSNADAQTLSSWASQHEVELNFTKTAEGLRISNEQAYQLYQEISKVDALQGQVAFQQLKENLIATKDEFKSISANVAYIDKLEGQIAELHDNPVGPDNKARIAALEEELALAKQINLERSTSADDSFNFMSNDIPAAQNNPLNYYKNWSEAIKTLNTAMKTSARDSSGKTHKGLIDYTDFYNIVTEMNNLAKISGPIILNDAYTLNGDLKSASKLIEAGAQALTTTDAGDIAVSLGDLGIDFQAGAGSMSEGIQKGIETMANSQVDMLDGLIQLLETIVAMEALGDIDTDKNGIDLSDIFTIETGDNGEQSIQEFTETYKKWQDEIKKKLDKNNKEFYDEDLANAMSSIKIGENSLAEMVQWDYTKFDMSTAKTFSSTMAALYKAAISDNYDLDNIAESVQQELASAGVFDQPITIDIGERTLIFTSKGHASINWADEDIKKIPEQLNKSKEDLSLLYKKYLDGTEFLTSEDVITVLALKSKLKITKTNNGKITEIEVDDGNGGTKKLVAGTDEFSRIIGRMALDDAGIDAAGEKVEGGIITRTVTYQLKNGIKVVTVTGDSNGIHWHSDLTGEDYPSEEAMQDAEYDSYRKEIQETLSGDHTDNDLTLTKEQWLYQNYHITVKTKVEWANGVDPSKDPDLRDEVMKLTSDGLTGISDWLQKNPPTDNQDGTFTVPIKGEDFTFVSEGGTDLSADLYNSLMSSLGLDGTLVNSITKGITDAFGGETGQAISKTIGDGIKLALKNGESKEGTEEVDIGDLTLKPSSTELDLGDLTSTVAKAAVKIAEAFANSLSIMPEKIEQATASVRSHFETLSQNVEDAVTQIKANIRDIQEHVPITWTINTVFPNNAILQHLLSGNYAGKGSGIEFTGDSSKLEEAAGHAEEAINGVGDTASSLPSAINIIITAEDQASSVISEIASAINNLQDKTVNITVRETVNKDGGNDNGSTNSGLGSGAQEPPTRVTGNFGLAKAAGTLMGELGPELVVQDGRYFVAGQNGAEFVNLQDDAIVFNHLQTEQLLKKGMSSTRGRAVTNERTAVAFAQGNVNGGPAMASASAALAALKQLRSMWASLASASVQDLAGAGGGGGGGGGDKDMAAYIKELEKWYNWLQKIAELEDKINYQEQLRSTISSSQRKNGSAYYSSLKDTLKNLQEQVKTEQSLIDAQQKYFDKRRKELNTNGPFNSLYTFDENGQLKYKKGALNKLSKLNETDKYGKPKMSSEQQYDYIVNTLGIDEQYLQTTATGEKIDTEQEGWQATAVQAFWDKMDADKEEMQSLHDSINEHSEALLAAQEQQNEILQEMRDNQLAVEQNVYDAIVDSRERAIEDAEAMRDALEESTNKFIDGLSSALDKERSMYEMQQSQTDLDQKRRRLAILQRTGGSNSEIASLQSDIASSERDLYFDKQQEQIDLIQEASDKQIEKLDQQIELDKELLEYQKAHGLLWSEVADIMKMDSAAITDFITSNNSEWWAKSPVQSAQDLQDAIFQTDQWVEFRDDQNSFFQNIIDTIYNTTTNAAPDNPTSTADSTTQLDNNGNGNNNTRVKYKSLNEKKHKKITQKKNKKGKWETTKEQKEDHDFDSKGKCTKCGYKKKKDSGSGTSDSSSSGNGSGSSSGASGNGGNQSEPIRTGFKYKPYNENQHYKIPIYSDGSTGTRQKENHSFDIYGKCTACGFKSNQGTTVTGSGNGAQDREMSNDISKIQQSGEQQTVQSLSDINLTQDELQKLRTSTLSNGLSAVNSAMKMNLAAINSSAYTTIDREKSTQIGSISLNMDVKQIANDYDAKRAGEKAMEEMLRIARKSTTATVRR